MTWLVFEKTLTPVSVFREIQRDSPKFIAAGVVLIGHGHGGYKLLQTNIIIISTI